MVCPVVCQRVSACPACGEGEAGKQGWPSVPGRGEAGAMVSGPWVKLPHGARSGLALVLVHGWTIWGKAGEYWVRLGVGGGLGSGAGGRKMALGRSPHSSPRSLHPSPHPFPCPHPHPCRFQSLPIIGIAPHFSASTGFPPGDPSRFPQTWKRKYLGFLIRGRWVSMNGRCWDT